VGKYIIRRLLQMIPVIIGVTFIIYVRVYALGDPTVGRCGERACPPATSPSSAPTTTSTSR
jgi:oligopeptide transport system permease protein